MNFAERLRSIFLPITGLEEIVNSPASRQPALGKRPIASALAFASMICAFLIDYYTNPVFDLYAMYLILAFLTAWFIGPMLGWGMLIAGILSWTFVDLVRRPELEPWALMTNSAVRAAIFIALIWSTNRIRVLNERLSQLSLSDELTGLPNRRALLSRGELELKKMRRSKAPLSVMFLDVDDFKKLNDTQGHDAGDALLEDTASILIRNVRATDFVARLGGDEFAVLFPETDGKIATGLASKIKKSANAALKKSRTPLSLSIGVATFSRTPDSIDAALCEADRLMYEVKRCGKDSILQRNVQPG